MAKALIGYMSSDLRNNARMALEKLVADNRALRARVAELEDSSCGSRTRTTPSPRPRRPRSSSRIEEMQPA